MSFAREALAGVLEMRDVVPRDRRAPARVDAARDQVARGEADRGQDEPDGQQRDEPR